MPYSCDHISSLWYPMYCGICEDVTPEWYEDEGKYLPKQCNWCSPKDAQYEDNFDDELWHNHDSCTKYLNGLYCVHGCPKHSYFVGPIVRNGPLQIDRTSNSAGIFLNCPSCNNISVPTEKYNWTCEDLRSYRFEGREISEILEEMPGWEDSTYGARSWAELPANAVKYIRRVEELTKLPVTLLSTSPERDDTILVRDPFEG